REISNIGSVDVLQIQIEMYKSHLRGLFELARILQEIEELLPVARTYLLSLGMKGNIILFGEEMAKRIKPNEVLYPEVQAILDENAKDLQSAKDILNSAEKGMEIAIAELSTINADVLGMFAQYEAEKAALGKQALDAVIADTVSGANDIVEGEEN
ncbi:MAG: hypothetical protein ABIG43_01570, partial [Chloroflexota bacterium]